ncbi:dipeptidase [Microbacterium sp. NPDC089695]|uniref:dipeptidase n=1 Tax=Microbacterium sp. NPDC089695 TaxID=3364198 RepID=UPI00381C770C
MIKDAARTLHERSLVADAHNDLLLSVCGRPVTQWPGYFADRWLPQLHDGGVNLQVLPVWVETRHQPESALRYTLRMIECAHRICEANPETTTLCLDGADIRGALESDRIAMILALESAPGIDHDVELFETMHRLGVRIASIAHTGRSALADGSEEDATGSRLTSSGIEAVHEMNRLGMIFDISHLGVGGVEHVLELTDRPVIATHSGARAEFDHHRNLSDAQLRAVRDNGGIVCANFYAGFLDDTEHTLDRLIDHVEHLVEVVGIGQVGIGPDFISEVLHDTVPPCCEDDLANDVYIPGLEGPRGLPLFTEGLLARGWVTDDVAAVLGRNLSDFLQRELGARA